jgi:HSP20 family protein
MMNTKIDLAKREMGAPTKAQSARQTLSPPVDVYENKDELLLVADMPGVTPEEVVINLDQDELTIESHRKAPPDVGKMAPQIPTHEYRRSFAIPRGLDTDKVRAEFSNGVLSLHLPKSPAVKPRQIQVRAG